MRIFGDITEENLFYLHHLSFQLSFVIISYFPITPEGRNDRRVENLLKINKNREFWGWVII